MLTATGLYERPRRRSAQGSSSSRPARDLGLRAYLRALLGHLYLEWEPPRPAEAREALASARQETKDSGFRAVIPLVEAYWGELLLAEGSPAALREADETLAAIELLRLGAQRDRAGVCCELASRSRRAASTTRSS